VHHKRLLACLWQDLLVQLTCITLMIDSIGCFAFGRQSQNVEYIVSENLLYE